MIIKIFLITMTLFCVSNLSAQCPGAIAESYRSKLQNAGTNMEATTAYSHLANYYNYKCKCDNGVVNPEELASFINNYSNSYNSMVSKYGSMTPVNGCKGIKSNNISSSNKTSNSQNNYGKLNNTYNAAENITNAAFGADSDTGKFVQNLNTANQMYGAIENGDYGSAASNLINIFTNSYANQNEQEDEQLNEQLVAQNIDYLNKLIEKVTILQTVIDDSNIISILKGEYSVLQSMKKDDLTTIYPILQQREIEINMIEEKYLESFSKNNEDSSNSKLETFYITTFDDPLFEMSLYSEPNLNSKVKYKCPKDSKVKVLDNTGETFFKVIVDGYSGYVSKHYLNDRQDDFDDTKGSSFITTFDDPLFEMSLYSEPNLNSKVKYKCPKDSKVKVLDNTGETFFKVIVNGYSGYVSKHYLKRLF